MANRAVNEKKYKQWKEQTGGGRIYTRKVIGQHGWYALYHKETDAEENTIQFWQEIYNEKNELKELHQKFPADTGHKKLNP